MKNGLTQRDQTTARQKLKNGNRAAITALLRNFAPQNKIIYN